MQASLAECGADLLGGRLKRTQALAGGDLSEIQRVVLEDGREAIVKGGPAPRVEARMLRALAAAGASTPGVLAVNDRALVLEALPSNGGGHNAWKDLGVQLKRLHAATGRRYGWHEDYAFGPVPVQNGWREDWPTFWGEQRLGVPVAGLPRTTARRLDRLVGDLPSRLPAQPPPALLHGDLWGGNILFCGEKVSLIDPACYYGHAEVDFAMLGLFGRPTSALFEAYGPLETGHVERCAIYQLWPALVHLGLFGAGYLGMVDRLLRSAGS